MSYFEIDIELFALFFSFVFKQNHVFNEKDNPSQNVVILEDELDDIDDNANLVDLPGLVFIDEKCDNPIVVDMMESF